MLNTEQILTRLDIDPHSHIKAVQDVRTVIEGSTNPLGAARALFQSLVPEGTEFKFTDVNEARLTVAHLVQDAILLGERYDPNQTLVKAAQWIVRHRENNPWAFAKPEGYSTVATETVIKHDVQVQVKEDGNLKKGGKQLLAQALYAKNSSMDNKALVQLFMKELNMSEAGARTYVYNCKKAVKP